jgi:hypothetical protein
VKNLVRVASLAIVLSTAMVSAPAFASGTNATTVAITASSATVASGKPVVFKAGVSPHKVGSTKITGTVVWTITGHDDSSVACATITPLNGGGFSDCKVGKAQLLAVASPYAVSASYAGDANFDPSTGSTTETVTSAVTRVKITIAIKPTSGASTVIQATVFGGPGTPALSGLVTFAAVSSLGTRGVKPYCAGSNPVPAANNSQPIVAGVATCTLPAGWFVVPPVSSILKHPKSSWAVSVSYNGNASFSPITASKAGRSNH